MRLITCLLLFVFGLHSSCINSINHRSDAEKYIKEKDYNEALVSINKAIELEPNRIEHLSLRVWILDELGLYKEELKVY